jgi:hypothetical protein
MRIFWKTLALVFLLSSQGWAAWDATKPANNGIINQAPAQIRANWEAIATGTDASLCINNAKTCAGAAIADSKLAQITSPAKVSGAALTLMGSIPSSANGQIPVANGGTGQSTAQAAIDALFPSQAGNSGKAMITNATTASWGYPASLTIASAAIGDILYYNGTVWTRLAAGTSGYYLKAAGAAAPAWTQPNVANGAVVLDGTGKLPAVDGSLLTGVGLEDYTVAGTTYAETPYSPEITGFTGSWTKKIEFGPLLRAGTIDVYFEIKRSSGSTGNVSARVYIGGVGSGASKDTTSASYTGFTTSDITVSAGNLIQIYLNTSGGDVMAIQAYRIMVDNPTSPIPLLP